MRKATKIVAIVTGVIAGIAGMEHGVFEVLQKGEHSSSLMFASMGAPCDPAVSWSACEPAMSIYSNFLIMGIITIVISMLLIVWTSFYLGLKGSGWTTILLSVLLLLFGGGFFPPLIGIVSGFTANSIHKPFSKNNNNGFIRFAAKLWPWPLVYFTVWGFAQFIIGYYFNDFLKTRMLFFILLFLAMLPLSILTAYTQDNNQELSTKES